MVIASLFKYNVEETGSAGGGGEYEVQTGFGWSNGVVIEFMALFGDELLQDNDFDSDYDAKAFKEEIELNTHFDLSKGKSKLVRKESNINFNDDAANKNDVVEEEDDKIRNHPALTIEEDHDEGDDLDDIEEEEEVDDDVDDEVDDVVGDVDGPISIPSTDKVNMPRAKKMSVKIDRDSTKRLIAFFERNTK